VKKKIIIISVVGCLGIVCLIVVAILVFGASIFSQVVNEEFRPLNAIPTTEGFEESAPSQQVLPDDGQLDGLSYITVMVVGYTDDADPENDGIAIDISYFDDKSELLSFTDIPIQVQIELYGYRNIMDTFDLSKAEKVYQGAISVDHSLRLGEMFGNYIRIPYEEINIDSSVFIEFGTISVTVDTPNGTFSDTEDLVLLYPLNK